MERQKRQSTNYNKNHGAKDFPPLHLQQNLLIWHRDGRSPEVTIVQQRQERHSEGIDAISKLLAFLMMMFYLISLHLGNLLWKRKDPTLKQGEEGYIVRQCIHHSQCRNCILCSNSTCWHFYHCRRYPNPNNPLLSCQTKSSCNNPKCRSSPRHCRDSYKPCKEVMYSSWQACVGHTSGLSWGNPGSQDWPDSKTFEATYHHSYLPGGSWWCQAQM